MPVLPALPHLEHVSIDLSLTVDQLDRYLAQNLPRAISAAACLLAFSFLVYTGQRGRRSFLSACRAMGVSLLALGLFAITAVPLARLHPTVQRQVSLSLPSLPSPPPTPHSLNLCLLLFYAYCSYRTSCCSGTSGRSPGVSARATGSSGP